MAQYNEAMRGRVFRLLEAGTSTREIREMTGVSKSTTNRWWAAEKRAAEEASTAPWPTANTDIHLPVTVNVPPGDERHREVDSVRLGTVVSVVLIVGAVLWGVWFLMQ